MKKSTLGSVALLTTGMVLTGYLAATSNAERTSRVQRDATPDIVTPSTPAPNQWEPVFAGVDGPDVTASRIGLNSSGSGDDFSYHGTHMVTLGGGAEAPTGMVSAFGVASTSCNVGNETAEWIEAPSARHPVIAPNLYSFDGNRFRQIGMGWVKHSFCAVSEPTCGSCSSTPCTTLGVGCADTYWATLNAQQSGIGPRRDINPWPSESPSTTTHTQPYTSASSATGPGASRGRLLVMHDDIQPGLQYVAEIIYVTHDEPFLNRANNASWRPVNVTTNNISGAEVGQASVRQGAPAILAWRDFVGDTDGVNGPDVAVKPAKLPQDGYYFVGYHVTDNGDGTWRYEYAVQNLNAHLGSKSFVVPVPAGVTITNPGFSDVAYHSGDGHSGLNTRDTTDWTFSNTATEEAAGEVRWDMTDIGNNSNALLWGQTFNFWFDADTVDGPTPSPSYMDQFRDEAVVNSGVRGPSEPMTEPPPCPGDLVPPTGVDADDVLAMINNWGCTGEPGECDGDLTGATPGVPDGFVNAEDILFLINNWGPCPAP